MTATGGVDYVSDDGWEQGGEGFGDDLAAG